MARTLKLDCITLTVTEKNKSVALEFDKFFKYSLYDGKVIARPFRDFFTTYVESFNGKFLASAGVSKAINLKLPVNWSESRRLIRGIVTGGNIGSTVEIAHPDKADDVLFVVSPELVTAEPFHFLLWMPKNFNKGILLIQGYTNATVADAFKQNLLAFFRQQCPRFTLHLNTYVDKETVDKFMNEMRADEIVFRRTRIEADKTDDTSRLIGKESKITVNISVKGLAKLEGFSDRLSRWTKGEVPALFEMEDRELLGVQEGDEMIIRYTTPDGHAASARGKKDFQLKPQIYIDPVAVPCGPDGRPDSEKIRAYLLTELAQIQAEIGYTDATTTT